MTSRFETCLRQTLQWEGGWFNHPRDPGGPTMKGVIQRVYDGWRDSQGLARRSVREIEDYELRDIYRRNYWDQIRGDELPVGVDMAVFDFAVNSGPGRAAKYLQRVLRMNRVDGHIGPATIGATKNADPERVIEELMADRRTFIRQISTYDVFGKGWERRCNGIEKASIAMLKPGMVFAGIGTWDTVIIPAPGRAMEPETQDAVWTPAEKAGATGVGLSNGQIGVEAALAAQRVTARGEWSWLEFVLEIASRPTFYIALGFFVSAVWMWLAARRRRWLLE